MFTRPTHPPELIVAATADNGSAKYCKALRQKVMHWSCSSRATSHRQTDARKRLLPLIVVRVGELTKPEPVALAPEVPGYDSC